MNSVEYTMERPHVVILGAGASKAAFPNGDQNGKALPLMDDFIETLNIQDIVRKVNQDPATINFEELYSQTLQKPRFEEYRKELERKIYDYFSNLEIKESPTIYDKLLLSLREKDCVATFNWDPLLVQAYLRNKDRFDLPVPLFLHGNAGIGYCKEHGTRGATNARCPVCRRQFKPTKLLFPIEKKNYGEDDFIAAQWNGLQNALRDAFMLTIFGFSAPESDRRAINFMKEAWGKVEDRNMEQIEIIDIKPEDVLLETWKKFIHTHHYDIFESFKESWISKHPRRTGEAYFKQEYLRRIIESNPIPEKSSLVELWSWFWDI